MTLHKACKGKVKVSKQTKHAVNAWRNRESAISTLHEKTVLNSRYVSFPSLFRNALSFVFDTHSRYARLLP